MKALIFVAALGLAALSLNGCALVAAAGALTPVEQVTVWTAVGAGAFGVGTLSLNALHDCKRDHGCKAVPLPP